MRQPKAKSKSKSKPKPKPETRAEIQAMTPTERTYLESGFDVRPGDDQLLRMFDDCFGELNSTPPPVLTKTPPAAVTAVPPVTTLDSSAQLEKLALQLNESMHKELERREHARLTRIALEKGLEPPPPLNTPQTTPKTDVKQGHENGVSRPRNAPGRVGRGSGKGTATPKPRVK